MQFALKKESNYRFYKVLLKLKTLSQCFSNQLEKTINISLLLLLKLTTIYIR